MTEPVRFEAEEVTPKESGRGMMSEAGPFIASVERLMIRVRSAKLKLSLIHISEPTRPY